MEIELLKSTEYISSSTDINVHSVLLDRPSRIHVHDFVELAYIASGKGRHEIDGKILTVTRGDFFLINSGVPHRLIPDENRPLLVHNCIFLPGVLQRELTSGENFIEVAYRYLFSSFSDFSEKPSYLALHDSNNLIVSILNEMESECDNRIEGYRQMLKADLYRLLISLFRLIRSDSHYSKDPLVYPSLVVESAIAYMRNHCETDISCEDLAARNYVSSSYLARAFKNIKGKTIINVLQDIRIEKACSLLADKDLSITEIASMCGYKDMKYFYSLFYRKTGVTPGKYRDNK